MITLGFDTTTSSISVVLLNDGKLMASYDSKSAVTHSTTLLPAIDSLLKESGISVGQINLISCSAGPGSFTGVRIGVATAKGLSAAEDIPTVGVSSLLAMASPFADLDINVLPVIGARRGNVYSSLFSCGGGKVIRITDDDLIAVSDIPELCKSNNINSVCVVGDEAEVVIKVLSDSGISVCEIPQCVRAEAGYGAALAGNKAFLSHPEDDYSQFSLNPIYLRKSQAERERDERLARENN